jgi:hypothetical protein
MRTYLVAVCLLASAGSVSAQDLRLDFRDGRVSLDATGVPVRTILAEWARLGGTKVVGGEKVTGAPLTIQLENVPEAQALEIVLRNVAGYMAAPRRADSAGASAYDRILVLPTSSAPAAASAANRGANPAANAGPRAARPFGPPVQNADMDPANAPLDESDTGVNEPPFQFPQQNPFQGAVGQPGPFGTPMPAGGQPPVIQFGQQGQTTSGVSINPTPQQPQPVMQFPGMPGMGSPNPSGFGIGAPAPGVILQPAQPGQPPRPPGGL